MNLQQLVQAVKDISLRSQDLNQLLQQLKVSEESLVQQRDQLLFVLAELDPARDSLGYLYLLYDVDLWFCYRPKNPYRCLTP